MPSTDSEDASQAPCAAHQDDVDNFRIGLEAQGTSGNVVARLVDALPLPPEKFLNDWTLDFVGADGEALDDVLITSARTYMPVHGHDGTFPPIITPLDEPGRFQVDDLNMWMRGPWLVQLDLSSASAGSDYVDFSVCIEE